MSNALSRRQFLKIAAGAGAGLVLGVYLPGCQGEEVKPHWLTGDQADVYFNPNVFNLVIDRKNIL